MASLDAEATLVAVLRGIHSYDVRMSDYGRVVTEPSYGRHGVTAACAAAADRAHLMPRGLIGKMDETCLVRSSEGIHGFLVSSLPALPLGDGQLRLLVHAHTDIDGPIASFDLEPAPAWLKRYELGLLEYLLHLIESQNLLLPLDGDGNRNSHRYVLGENFVDLSAGPVLVFVSSLCHQRHKGICSYYIFAGVVVAGPSIKWDSLSPNPGLAEPGHIEESISGPLYRSEAMRP